MAVAREKAKAAWDKVANDPGVVAGVIQILASISQIVIEALGRDKAPRAGSR